MLALLPASVGLSCHGYDLDGGRLTLSLSTTSDSACCPDCGEPSSHVHSRYTRTLRDLPNQGKATSLKVTARKFFCKNPGCARSLFCERLGELASRYAPCTPRLIDSHRDIAFALGGRPGARLAAKLAMPVSADTLPPHQASRCPRSAHP